jgi:transposase
MSEIVAGIDWASQAHRVCICDGSGRRLSDRTLAHSDDGLAELCRLLEAARVGRVALERPDGLLVGRLVEAGFTVIPIHPNQVAAARARFRAAGGKSDGFDAYVLAELARTDAHRFRALAPEADETLALRSLTRARTDLVGHRVALANQLRAELERFWPGAAAIFSEVDSPIALSFLERYPAPADAAGLGERRLAGFLGRHRYCGRRSPAELLGRLRAAPSGRAGEAEAEARRGIVLGLVAALRPVVAQIGLLTSQIGQALDAHPDGAIFRSLFRDPKSVVTAAELVAEIGDRRERYPDAGVLAADAGMCPVAIESGRLRAAGFRWACDKRLRVAVATLADASRHHNPWAADIYRRARSRGKDHPHAIRILGRAWLLVIWRIWQDRVPYDPARHAGLQRLQAAGG